ncbi:DUF4199 domain-containing protein [Pseudopedobacter beijingensis]|uniref:DUF4199 domain-containing protein n=1 Tax=Pseudopedobacter beijingensis TaxID=1207056 RepID=A0ABW4ICM1_9SPHI
MNELEVSPGKITFRWAWQMATIMVVATLLVHFSGTDQKSPVVYLVYVPFVFGLMMSIKQHRDKDLEGFISIKRAFTTGFRYASLVSFVMGVFMFIYLKYINAEVFEQSLQEAERMMLSQGKSSEEIETGINMARSWGVFLAAISSSIGYTLLGAFLSLIAAFIFKNPRPIYIEVEREEL